MEFARYINVISQVIQSELQDASAIEAAWEAEEQAEELEHVSAESAFGTRR
jgi:hypothetical protein